MKRVYKGFVLGLILVYCTQFVTNAKILDYSDITEKPISTYKTSYSGSFPNTVDYSDNEGYVGTYYKDGSSYVISGSAPVSKKVSITITSDSPSFSSSYYYSSGGYSGYIGKDGSYSSSSESKRVSGNASKGQVFGQICTVAGTRVPNPNYDESKFDSGNMATWKYWQEGSSWSGIQLFDEREVSSSNFDVIWSDTSPIYAYYDDGEYKGDVSISYIETVYIPKSLYVMTPANGYTMPYVGQHSDTKSYTYRYALSGTVYKDVYEQTYTGYVYSDDTRVWRQDYSGIAYKKVEKTLNAEITSDIPNYLEEGKSLDITITAKNKGTLSWTSDDLVKLQNLGSSVNIGEKFDIPKGTTVSPGKSYSWKISLPALSVGDYEFKFSMLKDNGDGNFGNEYSKTLKVYSLKPDNGNLNVTKYDYKKDDNNYYIKPGSTAEITVDGSFASYTGKYPTHNYVKYEDASTGNILEQKTSTSGTEFIINNITSNTFNKVNNSVLVKSNKDDRNIVTNAQKISIKGKDVTLNLHNKTSYENGSTNYGEYSDSGKKLIVDGTAPAADKDSIDISSDSDNLFTNISEIIETGSGVKEVIIEYSNGSSKVEEVLKPSEDGSYTSSKKVTDLNFGSNLEKIHVTIKAEDNVGNKGTIFDEDVYLIKLEAEVLRVLEPHTPIFKEGEKGVLKIKLYGGFDKVKITFPIELSSLDDTLDVEFNLDPKNKTNKIDYEFYIPIDTPNKEYMVQVKGYKNGIEKVVYPTFSVTGNILDDLRTKILFNKK